LDCIKLTTKKRQIAIGGYVKKLLKVSLLAAFLLAIPFTVLADVTPLDRAKAAGWNCDLVIAGEAHCFDPGDAKSKNSATVNVKVYKNSDGSFLGTEQIWIGDLWAGQPCPQDVLLDVGFGIACHHYSH
jgi:hypothetical protein